MPKGFLTSKSLSVIYQPCRFPEVTFINFIKLSNFICLIIFNHLFILFLGVTLYRTITNITADNALATFPIVPIYILAKIWRLKFPHLVWLSLTTFSAY